MLSPSRNDKWTVTLTRRGGGASVRAHAPTMQEAFKKAEALAGPDYFAENKKKGWPDIKADIWLCWIHVRTAMQNDKAELLWRSTSISANRLAKVVLQKIERRF